MEFVAVTCQNCGSKMHVLNKSVRKEMYCTIHCLESSTSSF
ncbi:protein NinF [uncultured Methanomethylovorans sp.]|nr:protein NinF [uncultured Methanomethylovorans sp.]